VARYFGDPGELAARERELATLFRDLESQAPQGPPPEALAWPAEGKITSPFGDRFGRMHTGVDIAAPEGRPIHAPAAGRILFVGSLGAYGSSTIIGHGGGVLTLYGHQSAVFCRAGQDVQTGDVIGRVGSSGRATGPHLHFEIRTSAVPIDPSTVQRGILHETIGGGSRESRDAGAGDIPA